MPNGGYPMHLQLPAAENLGLHIERGEISVARLSEIDGRTDFLRSEILGALSDVQREALLFHVLYWTGGGSLPSIEAGSKRVSPQYFEKGCFYGF